jgi:hypothetical protein
VKVETGTQEAGARASVAEHPEIRNFVDSRGRLRQWPAKRKLQLVALEMLASQFEDDIVYTEREVNGLLNLHHTFGDAAMLRRELFEMGHLGRTRDGAQYWKQERPQA